MLKNKKILISGVISNRSISYGIAKRCVDLGAEIVCYKDVDEAALLIKYYLSNDYEREKIKLAGVKKARRQHTYIHRIKHFMEEINKMKIEKNDS